MESEYIQQITGKILNKNLQQIYSEDLNRESRIYLQDNLHSNNKTVISTYLEWNLKGEKPNNKAMPDLNYGLELKVCRVKKGNKDEFKLLDGRICLTSLNPQKMIDSDISEYPSINNKSKILLIGYSREKNILDSIVTYIGMLNLTDYQDDLVEDYNYFKNRLINGDQISSSQKHTKIIYLGSSGKKGSDKLKYVIKSSNGHNFEKEIGKKSIYLKGDIIKKAKIFN
jgi:hypothetical protein